MDIRTLLLGIGLVSFTTIATAETLVVNLSGIKADKGGEVRVGVFDTEESFPYGTWVKGVELAVDAETMRIEVTALPAGRYAVSVMQDLNGNGELDKNFVGMPREPYGFSGDWKSGAASFDQAAIEVGAGETEISITLK